MKKLATALVSAAAIMTMSTTAFAAENPAEVFDRVMEKNNTIQVDITDIAENTDAAVEMNYSVDMKSKIITITKDEEQIDKAVEKADGAYTKEDLENVLDDLDSSFSYSVDGNQLTLTEREYGEQFTFIRK